jgi:hypothetical protein
MHALQKEPLAPRIILRKERDVKGKTGNVTLSPQQPAALDDADVRPAA